MNLVNVTNLKVEFSNGTIIRYPDLSVDYGDVVAVRGPNGCGKTTMLLTLGDLIEPAPGSVITWDPSLEYRKNGRPLFGIAVSGVGENPRITTRALISSAAVLYTENDYRKSLRLDDANFPSFWSKRYRVLSMGQKQRVRIAQAFMARAPIVLLDEPTAGLDPSGLSWLKGLIKTHCDSGGSVIVTTHDNSIDCTKSIYLPELSGSDE